ncbi:MAG: hypothetical protein Q9160_005641 [Pyrenula sp. 1 TL-2023]
MSTVLFDATVPQSLWALCQLGFGLIVLNKNFDDIPQILGVFIYRLTFHPLAKYPGPWLAKVSDLDAAFYAMLGQTHLVIYRAHQRYGPIVRLGPNKLVFESADALQGE